MMTDKLTSPDRFPSLAGVERAAEKIAALLPRTPLLSLQIGMKTLWCKAEMLQPIGAFKIRGGWHRLSDMSEEEKSCGVVAYSSGNHAQGVAWAAQKLGVKAVIVMPEDAPKAKMEATRAMGAEIVSYVRGKESREEIAAEIAAQSGATIVPSFDDPWIIEGQGSAGVEIVAQMQEMTGQAPSDFISCCGGGGLAAGSALAIRHANPEARIFVAEPQGWDDMAQSLEQGRLLGMDDVYSGGVEPPATLCDALQTPKASPMTYAILRDFGAKGVAVTDEEVKAAMRYAFRYLRLVVEPGGAVALAAVLSGKIEIGEHAVITLSGGNVDAALYREIIDG